MCTFHLSMTFVHSLMSDSQKNQSVIQDTIGINYFYGSYTLVFMHPLLVTIIIRM